MTSLILSINCLRVVFDDLNNVEFGHTNRLRVVFKRPLRDQHNELFGLINLRVVFSDGKQ